MIPFFVLLIGLLLIFLEFFLPGAILGTLGVLAVIASTVLFALGSDSLPLTLLFIAVALVSVGFLLKFAINRLRASKNIFFLSDNQEGYVATTFDPSLVGKVGMASTDLKPGGRIVVQDKKYQALSQSGYISKGEKVMIIGGEGESLIVKHQLDQGD